MSACCEDFKEIIDELQVEIEQLEADKAELLGYIEDMIDHFQEIAEGPFDPWEIASFLKTNFEAVNKHTKKEGE